MKRNNGKNRRITLSLLSLFATVLAMVILMGCQEPGTLLGDGGDGGNDSGTPAEDGVDDDPTSDADDGADVLDTSDMVLHLGFDGNLTDQTGTSDDMLVIDDGGTQTTAVYAEDRNGNASNSIEFDGSRALRVSDIDLSGKPSITVTAWIRDNGSVTDTERWIATYVSGPSASEFALRIRELGTESWQDGSFEAFVENSGSNGTRTTELVFPGNWVHVAMVYDGDAGEMRLYQDGTRHNSTSVSLSIDAGNLIIGGGTNNSSNDFFGRVDDVAIFTRALSDAEIVLAKDQVKTN